MNGLMKKSKMKRPLKDKRPFGPLVNLNQDNAELSQPSESPTIWEESSSESNTRFNSIDDLPDSPMLKQYVEREIEYTGLDEVTVINSTPVKKYMQRLGVWEKAVRMNS